MIGIQIITHGKMAEGILDSVDMIIGDTENVAFNELKRGQDIEEFREEVKLTTESLDTEDGVLFFVDMFGASPYNTALINSRDIEVDNYKVITGVNLPLVIEAISTRSSVDLEQLYSTLLEAGKDTIVGWEK